MTQPKTKQERVLEHMKVHMCSEMDDWLEALAISYLAVYPTAPPEVAHAQAKIALADLKQMRLQPLVTRFELDDEDQCMYFKAWFGTVAVALMFSYLAENKTWDVFSDTKTGEDRKRARNVYRPLREELYKKNKGD